MKFIQLLQLSLVALCIVHGVKCEETLIDTFNDIYSTCLIRLNTDCVQPKAIQWLNKVIAKREIRITDDLTIIKNDSVVADEEPLEVEGARSAELNIISKVDDFLATHYLNIRYPKSIINDNVPSFMVSYLNRFVPEGMQVPLEEGAANEGRGLVKKVLVPFLLGLKFKTTVLLPLAFALIALKAWKALTLGLISLVVSTAVVVFKLAKPKVVNYEILEYPHHHHYDQHVPHVHAAHLEHFEAHPHHLDVHAHHLDVNPHHFDVPHGHVEHAAHLDHLAAHDIAYPAHL